MRLPLSSLEEFVRIEGQSRRSLPITNDSSWQLREPERTSALRLLDFTDKARPRPIRI
jgi:hypothetical protein